MYLFKKFQEHRGQVILYSMMMSERRPDPGKSKNEFLFSYLYVLLMSVLS